MKLTLKELEEQIKTLGKRNFQNIESIESKIYDLSYRISSIEDKCLEKDEFWARANVVIVVILCCSSFAFNIAQLISWFIRK